MASQAEVELVINTANALPELERELEQIIEIAEGNADDIDLDVAVNRQAAVRELASELAGIVDQLEGTVDPVQIQAELDALEALQEIDRELQEVIDLAEEHARDIELEVELDANMAALDAELDAIAAELEAGAPEVELDVEIDRDGRGAASIGRLTRGLGGLAAPLARTGAGIFGLGVAASSAAPLLASVAGALEAVAPAAALAVSGILAVQLATNTVKLAMIGVEDAVKAAFDPGTKPGELAEALKGLAPPARAFVVQLAAMKKDISAVQQTVQGNFFQGLDKSLRELGKTALPVVSKALAQTATALNKMAKDAASAASELGRNGTLGTALDGAVAGLNNLRSAPGQVVTALGQIGAAAAPAFDRVTQAAAKAATSISLKLGAAFESGALEDAIDGAVDAIAQLGRVAGNVFGGLGNIIGTVSSEGEGLFSTLEKVTQAFEDVTASEGFQRALKALTQTLNVVVETVLPLLTQALTILGPVFEALGPPVQILVRALGEGLGRILTALEPVLVSIAHAFGQLVIALTPVINLAATLIAAILPSLVPLFETLGQVINTMVPFIETLANTLAAVLGPILEKLATEVLPVLLPPFVEMAQRIFPLLTDVLVKLTPSFITLAEAFAELLVQLAPILVSLTELQIALFDELMPFLQPLLDLMIKLTSSGFQFLADILNGVVVPALRILVEFLRGDFSAAQEHARELVRNLSEKVQGYFRDLAEKAVAHLADLARRGGEKVQEMARNIGQKVQDMVNEIITDLQALPQRAADALGNTAQTLVSAGRDLVQGFINGIKGKIGELAAVAQTLADTVSGGVMGFLDINSPSRVMRDIGNDTMDGFSLGLTDGIPDLRSQLQGIASLVPSFALPDGQSIKLPQFGAQQGPSVQVFIGNEQLNGHIDARHARIEAARDRLMIRGVRS